MSEAQPLATPFPGPPPFYRSFTKANTDRLSELEAQAGDGKQLPTAELPEELRLLRPPTPPLNGEYTVFGEEHSLEFKVPPIPSEERILPPPTEEGQKVPLPSPQALLTVTRSILLNYLELIHLLIANPAGTEYGPKWEDLRDLFRNSHSLLNSYREWQSRETLIELMEEQVQQGVEAKSQWEGLEKQVDGLLKSIAESKESVEVELKAETVTAQSSDGRKKAGELIRMWEILEDEMED